MDEAVRKTRADRIDAKGKIRGVRVPCRRVGSESRGHPLEPCDAVRNTATGTDLKSSPTESEAFSAV
jgi:hypothetical protein